MNGLIEGLAVFALGLGAVVLILIWHNSRVQSIRDSFVRTCTNVWLKSGTIALILLVLAVLTAATRRIARTLNGWPK